MAEDFMIPIDAFYGAVLIIKAGHMGAGRNPAHGHIDFIAYLDVRGTGQIHGGETHAYPPQNG